MARMPGAVWRPLGDPDDQPAMRAHNILCFHTMVGSLRGTDAYFREHGFGGNESHFGVGGSTDSGLDGGIWQWQDTGRTADANADGNPEVVSIETSDGGNPDRPWSTKQLAALVEIGVWVCKLYKIPPRLINGNEPGSRGIAYHRQGCDHSSSYRPRGWPYDQWRVAGGVRWSSSLGKTCPGNVRIKQLVDIVIPRIRARVEGREDDVSAEEIWTYRERDTDSDAIDYVKSTFHSQRRTEAMVAKLVDDEGKLSDLIARQAEATADAVARKFQEMGGDPGDYETTKRAVKDALREGNA